jgi:hypothetical protein
MTFTTTYVRFGYISICLTAVGFDTHFSFKEREWSVCITFEFHMFTCVGLKDVRDWTCKTQVGCPLIFGSLQQAAFFDLSAAVIVTVEIFTFLTSGCFHKSNIERIQVN